MKSKNIGSVGALAMMALAVINPTNSRAVAFTDPANGPNVNPAWVEDRRLPSDVSIQNVGGNDRLHLGVTPANYGGVGSFYNYQGIQRPAEVTDWVAKAQIEITSELLGGFANTSFWLRTGLVGDESTADYNIIAFRNPTGLAGGFYTFDDINGLWLPTAAIASLGWHDFQMEYISGSIVYSIDGSVVRTDNSPGNPLYADEATTAFLEIYNYGDRSYGVNFDNISVTGRSSPVPDNGQTLTSFGLASIGLILFHKKLTAVAA